MQTELTKWDIDQLQKECRGLLVAAFERGWTTSLIAHLLFARALSTGNFSQSQCADLLQEIANGDFDFLFFDSHSGQSLN
jgi:hypothetical protein